MTRKKILLLGLAAIALGLQFIRTARNESPLPPGKSDFLVSHAAPPDIRRLLQTSCYDCHSNHTRYPWYANIQPVGWWLTKHINDGKDSLNLAEFADYTKRRQGLKLDAMMDEISERTMPLKSYLWIHHDARLSDADVKRLTDWLQGERDALD